MAIDDENKGLGLTGEPGGPPASRARNRTVMLTPEITGEVRARLAQDMAAGSESTAPGAAGEAQKGMMNEGGFGGRFTAPASSSHPTQAPSQERDFEQVIRPGVQPTPAPTPPSPQREVKSAVEVAPPSPYRVRQGVIWGKLTPVTGFLVSYDEDANGEVFELRMGRLIVTSEVPGAGNFLVLDHDTVSPMHAIIRMASFGEIQILDQLSEHGTRIIRGENGKEEDLSGDKSILHHGDTVFFGDRRFLVCLVSREDQ